MAEGDQFIPCPEAVPETLEERLTRQFYEWEVRGRGWQVWDEPVELEPPFRPFLGHYDFGKPVEVLDDARKPTFLSSLADRVKQWSTGTSQSSHVSASDAAIEEPEPEPDRFQDDTPVVEVQAALPPQVKITKDAAEQFLMSLGYVSRPVSFEVIGTSDSITVQIACGEHDRRQVREQLQAYFPDALLAERTGYLRDLWDEAGAKGTVLVEFGLSSEFMRPLRCFERFDPDPLAGAIGGMVELAEGELGILQVLFAPARHPWPESIFRAVTDGQGRSFFADDPAMVSLAGEKIARPLFATVIRVAAQSPTGDRAWRIAQGIGKSLRQFSNPRSNELIPLVNDGYEEHDHVQDLLLRRSHRTGMLLNSDELVSMGHLPSASVRSEKLKREGRKTKAAPALALGHALVLGENYHSGKTVGVTLNPEQRVRHTYVIGASGTGKSTLLLNLIVQDIQNGEGFAVLDPHGDLIDQVFSYIPEERFADVVLLDPSDEGYPVGFNILSAHSELERNLLASDLVAVFRRLSTSWGDQMTSVLGNAILAFLESGEGGTLADLRRFLVEADFRQQFLQTVQDPEVVYYWQKEFPLLTGKPQGPILTRLDTFLRPKLIRNMVSQKENRLDFGAIMNQRKIFLAKLAQGLIGEENSYLLGTLLVSKFNQLAMSRQETRESERRNFYLYVDEFHNFITPSMASIVSGARKYRLGLILAHQDLHQLWNRDSDVASAVISNPYTRICFRLGDFDAKKLEEGFSFFGAKDLQNLGIGQAICRIERAEYDFNLKTLPLPEVEPKLAQHRREQIVSSSRQRYATRREEVETLLVRERPTRLPQEPVRERKPAPKPEMPLPPTLEKVTARVEREVQPRPQEPPPMGRGGQQHKYLQQLIKRWAEHKGYRATIEKPILDGLGSVDVALEKDNRSIACEISVTSTVDQELGNIQKCLAADFNHVVLVSSERKTLNKAKELISADLDEEGTKRVQLLTPEELFSFLEALEAEDAGRQQTVRGYKVKVQYRPVAEAEKKARRQAISQVILGALKKLKGDSR